MTIKQLVKYATDKSKFQDLTGYVNFCADYLSYVEDNLQAIIVSQNENNYSFYQYKKEANFQITRPINTNLMISANEFKKSSTEYLKILKSIKDVNKRSKTVRNLLNNSTYTIQQSIGAALDALPAGKSNTARKLNGKLF